MNIQYNQEKSSSFYEQLADISSDYLVIYPDKFQCPMCFRSCEETEGIILQGCLHVFCRACLVKTIELSESAVFCPFRNENYSCSSILLENEIKALVSPEVYDTWLFKSLTIAEKRINNGFENQKSVSHYNPEVKFSSSDNSRIQTGGERVDRDLSGYNVNNFRIEEPGKLDEAAGFDEGFRCSHEKSTILYTELATASSDYLVIYPDKFECPICSLNYEEKKGIILQECLHVFCRNCLVNTIKSSESVAFCPFKNGEYTCSSTLLETEIRALLSPEAYDLWLSKSLAVTETIADNEFIIAKPLSPCIPHVKLTNAETQSIQTGEERVNRDLSGNISRVKEQGKLGKAAGFDDDLPGNTSRIEEQGKLDEAAGFDDDLPGNTSQIEEQDKLDEAAGFDDDFPGNICRMEKQEKLDEATGFDADLCECKVNFCHIEQEQGKLDEAAGFDEDIRAQNIKLFQPKGNQEKLNEASGFGECICEKGNSVEDGNFSDELAALSSDGLVIYQDKFECPICLQNYEEKKGIILQGCLHIICRDCLLNTIEASESAVTCPYESEEYSCSSILTENEIKALLSPEAYDAWLSNVLALAENNNLIQEDKAKIYDQLADLSSDPLVHYTDKFECPICFDSYEELEGIILKECLHVFCKDCLMNTVEMSEDVNVACPFRNDEYSCSNVLSEQEIKALLSPEAYDKRLWKTLVFAEASMPNAFHCKTPDCKGWCIVGGSTVFYCPVCSTTNCVVCKVIHEGITCAEYKDVLTNKSGANLTSKLSEAAVNVMIQAGDAMKCSKCDAIITKQLGCDSVVCSFCRTMLCWATKGPRWGPGGAGDTSGGCRCNVNGRKCHPNCQNCH